MKFEKAKEFILRKLERELSKNLVYHNVEHTKDVYSSAETLARLEKIEGEDLTLLLTAVLFHDAGYLVTPKEHEQISCGFALKYLPDYDYTSRQIKRICAMIMATRIPQTPYNKLEEVICDADLYYLGRDDFFATGDRLYEEWYLYGIVINESEWNSLRVRFLEQHRYFTGSAKKMHNAKKNEYIAIIKDQLKNGGKIVSVR